MQMKVLKQRICFLLSVVIVVSGLLTACQNTTNMQADSETNSVSESVSEEMEVTEDMTMINEQELRELDQLIAWGMKHGVHIQLSISNALNGSGSFDISDNEWELFRAYWEAIAVRYAGIPTCYLF